MLTIEYRVRPVTRYIVTRWHTNNIVSTRDGITTCTGQSGGTDTCGEFDRQDMAEKVAKALADAEPEGHVSYGGYPLDRCLTSIDAADGEQQGASLT